MVAEIALKIQYDAVRQGERRAVAYS